MRSLSALLPRSARTLLHKIANEVLLGIRVKLTLTLTLTLSQLWSSACALLHQTPYWVEESTLFCSDSVQPLGCQVSNKYCRIRPIGNSLV